ncbi:cupredoxin domain-containing protein [Aliiroseovarius sp. S2029]|uniref:cupredoxin domain-containing protein n=1 Tax=Aliiroseovarius sp. S2029 TaxID=2936988 RepID=UPI0020BE9FAB|nr:cupredoxin domain-containing protein [Aliiroseovarius sp. S2029]MCK8484209.1 cupredoxin domain-containing protein [Aliiroseovarius sp. S2029]
MKRIIAIFALAANIATPVLAEEHRVTIRNMAFKPKSLDVVAGDTIVFVNAGRAPHTATASSGAFDTGRIRPGEAVRVTINGSGGIDYFCDYHPSMRGRMAVN